MIMQLCGVIYFVCTCCGAITSKVPLIKNLCPKVLRAYAEKYFPMQDILDMLIATLTHHQRLAPRKRLHASHIGSGHRDIGNVI